MRYIPNQIVKLYDKSPIWSRNIASTAYGFLKNRKERTKLFYQCLAELEQSQWWPLEKLQELQNERLKKLIKHCSEHVPYYQKKFAEYGIIPSQIQTPDDLKKIPTLTKEDVRKNTDELIADNFDKKKLRAESTSGTTGTPLTVFMNDESYIYGRAIIFRQRKWAGYVEGKEWIGILSGYKVVSYKKEKPPFWTKNYIGKQLHLSSYHLNSSNTIHYFDVLRKTNVKFLKGYPSSIAILAQYFQDNGLELNIKAVLLSSEPLYEWQVEVIKRSFNCSIYNYYAQAEQVVTASSCGNSTNMHVNLEAGILELRKISNNHFTLIGSSLVNFGMPLIRYELNDITEGFSSDCPCGRKHPLLKPVETKMEDIVITPEGNLISASLLTFPFKKAKGVAESQIIQKDKYSLVVKLVTNNLFTNAEELNLINNISSCVGLKMKIFIEKVDKIPRTKNGKFRFVVSEIDIKN